MGGLLLSAPSHHLHALVYDKPLWAEPRPLEPPPRTARTTHCVRHPGEHPDLTWLCNEFYGVNSCKQKTQGCLWNFPGTNDVNWHRDYPEHWELLTGKCYYDR